MEQIDQYGRPAPKDKLESGDAGTEDSVDEVLDTALTGKDALSNDSAEPSATYGSITNMESQNQETWEDRPETDPFEDKK